LAVVSASSTAAGAADATQAHQRHLGDGSEPVGVSSSANAARDSQITNPKLEPTR
jgi:hypothetical protein